MPITYPCPHCQNTLTLDTRLAGQNIFCPLCQETLTAPALGIAVTASPKPARPAAPPQPAASPRLEHGAQFWGGCLVGLAGVLCMVALPTAAVLVYLSVPRERNRPDAQNPSPANRQVAVHPPDAPPAKVAP